MKKFLAIFLALCMMCTVIPVVAESAPVETKGGISDLLGSLFSEGEESGADLSSLLGSLSGGEGSGFDLGGLLGGLTGGDGSGLDLSALLGSLAGEDGSFDLSALLGSLGIDGESLDLGSLLGSLGIDGESLDLGALLGSLGGEAGGFDLSGLLGGLTGGEGEDLGSLFGSLFGEETGSKLGDEAGLEESLSQLFTPIEKPENAVAAESIEAFYGTWTLHKVNLYGMELGAEYLADISSTFSLILAAEGSHIFTGDPDKTLPIQIALADGALSVTAEGDAPAVFYLLDDGDLLIGYGGMLMYLCREAAK